MKKTILLLFLLLLVGSDVTVAKHYTIASINRIATREKLIALTFDAHDPARVDQPGVGEILTVLEQNRLKCTFFATGDYLQFEPEIVDRIVRDGHEVGNHTFTHSYISLQTVTKTQIISELEGTAKLFEQRYHHRMAGYWRAPYGLYNQNVLDWAREAGFQHIGWTADLLDWVADPHDPRYLDCQGLLNRFCSLIDQGADGDIILMHLNAKRTTQELATVLPQMIAYGQARGYRFVTVSRLLNTTKAGSGRICSNLR